jgi:hypothetical protein
VSAKLCNCEATEILSLSLRLLIIFVRHTSHPLLCAIVISDSVRNYRKSVAAPLYLLQLAVEIVMSNGSHRKRGGTFHLEDLDSNEDNDHNVQFVTPYYEDPAMPEPLDLSKLCLDDDLFEKEDDEAAAEKAMEEMQTRGRSRSRSVHENDLAAVNYIPTDMANNPADHGSNGEKGKKNGSGGAGNGQANNANNDEKANRRGGPLQQREVQALKKVRQ